MLGYEMDHHVIFWYPKDGNDRGGAHAFPGVDLRVYFFPLTLGLRSTRIVAAYGRVPLRSYMNYPHNI